MTAAVGGWVAFSAQWSASLGEIEQEKASKPWPEVICTSRVTSLGPLGCYTMQRILDLFTPHLASKATTTGGGRGEGQRRGSWLHLQTGGTEGELCLSLKRRHEVSRRRSRFCMLLMGGRANNCFGISGRWAPISGQTGHTQRLQTGLDSWITLIPLVQLSS